MQKLCALCSKIIPKDDKDFFEETTLWVKKTMPYGERIRTTGKYAHGACVRGDGVKAKVEVIGQEPLPLEGV
jgi:hypothetical protein